MLTATRFRAVVVGASAGGPAALARLLAPLPADFPLPLLVVQHLHRLQEGEHLRALGQRCRLRIKEAEPGEPAAPGAAYFAPPDYHLLVEPGGALALSVDPKVNHSRPAIDVTFASAAAVWGSGLVGVILTGASRDGALGLREVGRRGGLTIVQDPADAQSPYMPAAAAAEGPVDHLVPLDAIPALLLAAAGLAAPPPRGDPA